MWPVIGGPRMPQAEDVVGRPSPPSDFRNCFGLPGSRRENTAGYGGFRMLRPNAFGLPETRHALGGELPGRDTGEVRDTYQP